MVKVVILSGAEIEDNLSVVFGDILPIELPLSNRQLITHQIESLPTGVNFDIFVTIPQNYRIELPSNVTRINTDVGISLIESMFVVSSYFQANDQLFLYYGDSLFVNFDEIDFNLNSIFVQKPNLNYNWGSSNNEGMVPAGGFVLKNSLFSELISKSINFNEFYSYLNNSSKVTNFHNFEWLDFGHILTYYNSRIKFLESRHFNSLNFDNGFIVKKSHDIYKMWCEYQWLKFTKDVIPLNIPYTCNFEISNNQASYKIEYINHPTVSDLYVFGKHPMDFFVQILFKIKSTLYDLRNGDFGDLKFKDDSNLLVNKLIDRRNKIIEISNNLEFPSERISSLIEENLKYFENKNIVTAKMHGDLCFSNILFNISNFQPILIDPRGNISEKGFSFLGPIDYDLYKLAQSFVFGYDFLIANRIEADFFSIDLINTRLNIFCSIFECEKLDIIMGVKNLFLTMIPLHSDSSLRQTLFLQSLLKLDNL